MSMIPTPELRFVEREDFDAMARRADAWVITKVLQQKWKVQDGNYPTEEWRDVPTVKEPQ
jgi:hypothetical protein